MDQKNINKKVLWGVFSVFFLLMSVGVGLVLNNQVQKTNVGASGVNLTLTTNNTNPKVNDVISVAVAMDTQGMAVTGLDLKVKYDPNKLMPTAITSGGFLPNIFIPGVISSNTAGIVLGCPIDNSGPHPVSGSGLAAQITFIVKNAGASTISIEPDTKISVSGQTVNMIGNLTPIQITATAANTCTGTGSCTTLFCPTMAPCPSGMACPQVMPSCITTNGNCINGVCLSSTPNPSVCGGIQGILCPSGKECIYSNGTTNAPYPDATGNCQASTPKASPTPSPTPSRSPSPTPSKSPSPTRTPSPIPTRSPSPTPSRSPSPTPTKSPSPSPSPIGTGYTMAQIATHNTVSNCWLLMNEKVYNVTNYISSHPGGTSVITSNCGKDATQAFAAIGHSNTAKNILAQYLIGYLLSSKTPTPSPTNNRIAGDVDSNGIINIVDVGILIDNFGDNPLLDTRPDLNNDGRVNIIDLGIIIDNYPQ